jgi:hypothetical protein
MGRVCHWRPFWSTTNVRFIGQCWYFNPQRTPMQAINKASSVWTLLVSWDKMHKYYVLTFKSGFVEGFRRWRGYILAPQRIPDLQGSCSLASHCSLMDRSEQNSSKLQHSVCDILEVVRLQRVDHTSSDLMGDLAHLLHHISSLTWQWVTWIFKSQPKFDHFQSWIPFKGLCSTHGGIMRIFSAFCLESCFLKFKMKFGRSSLLRKVWYFIEATMITKQAYVNVNCPRMQHS